MAGLPASRSTEWLAAVHPDDAPRVLTNMRRVAAGDEVPADVTFRIVPPDGPVRWLVAHSEVVERDEQGRPVRLAGSLVDATELELANAEVARLLDFMTDGYVTLGVDWRIRFVNSRAARFLGRRRDELVGAVVWDCFPEVVGTDVDAHLRRAMGGEDVELEAFYAPLDAWYELRVHPLPDGVAIYFRDVTRRRQGEAERGRLLAKAERASRELVHAATHDPLTDLPNRLALAQWLDHHHGGRADAEPLSLLFLDLDRFKLVNDSHGHAEGDALLVEAGRRLRRIVRPGDLVARLGGDEFVVAITGRSEPAAVALAERVLDAFRAPFPVQDRRLVVTVSVGIAFAADGATPETLIRDADAALYQAKDAGRNRIGIFDDEVRQRVVARLGIEADLREALDRREVSAHHQPIFDVRTGAVVGVEVLARWDSAERGTVPAGVFVPIAEETGLVLGLGDVVFDRAVAAAAELDRSPSTAGATVWVNVSALQLEAPSFAPDLVVRLSRAQLLDRVGIEFTESALARDASAAEAALRLLEAAGLRLAIDDFGTGYSSLARLARHPVDVLKIDRSFVQRLGEEAGVPVVAAIVELAHAIGAEACAEGVETAEQLARLRALGVDTVSGFLLCRPVPLEDLEGGAAAGRALLTGRAAGGRLRPTVRAEPRAHVVDRRRSRP
jgi:diguanylate cyclase (GGDEF)-like protein